ncbi:hypothetical protein K469DRAFT_724288 [Zopfia rhizophila CBS 207.26]|uniref:Uncharacterized protein n=1 Tax=Zopfia rhizophila CBS 207.26 TaxID=1314779 RepID=A0A6A6EAY8_9PEZI|nr:hypothetical protein K469DRAFT_724288 [Zopfia rhizophila CBS 207.26]
MSIQCPALEGNQSSTQPKDNPHSSHAAPTMKARPVPPRRVAARLPNCTHITMDRVYGQQQHCQVCGRQPSIGFLYICRQDLKPTPSSLEDVMKVDVEHGASPKSALREQLGMLGLSKSVIDAAENGLYTPEQLEQLKTQKVELKQVISDVLQGQQINAACARLNPRARPPSNNDGTFQSRAEIEEKDHVGENPAAPYEDTEFNHGEQGPPICTLKACHTCRPYYKDRVWTSINAILANELEPLTPEDAALLPTKDLRTMKTIGLRTPPLLSPQTVSSAPKLRLKQHFTDSTDITSDRASQFTFMTTQSDMDELSQMRRPRRRFYNLSTRDSSEIQHDLAVMGWRKGLKNAFQGIFRPSRESSSEGSNITLPLARTGTHRNVDQKTSDFDLGSLKRVRAQKEKVDAAHMEEKAEAEALRGMQVETIMDATVNPSYRLGNVDDHSNSSSEFSVYSAASEAGSEVEVQGGVALTEEAVETHTPDILRAAVATESPTRS